MELALNPTIVVQYKAKSSRLGLLLIMALSPFWAIWAPAMIVWAIQVMAASAIIDAATQSMVFFTVVLMLGLTLISVFLLMVCLKSSFAISSEGVSFPLAHLFELKFKRKRKWIELASIEFVDLNAGNILSDYPNTMKLKFMDGSTLPLSLAAFRREDLQSFVLSLQSYVPQLPISPPLSEVQLGIEADSTAQKALSFTQIWEDDMSSRFGSTAFVPLESGARLLNGKLEVLGQIAFGGLSAIYLAKNSDEKLCIIKEAVVPSSAEQVSREKAMEHFSREAKILMTLKHPKIAGVHDCFVENGHHYLLLEYIDGKDLRHFVKEKGPQKESVVLRWAIEIAEVLDYLHNLNPPILHRDLTPDNLVLQADGSIAVIDFGAANEFLGTATGTLIGKQSYISPEQFRGKACPASDLYSLGATLHYLLTGEDPDALSQSHPGKVVPALSEEMDQLIADLTAIDHNLRIASAKELADRCRLLLSGMRQKATTGAL